MISGPSCFETTRLSIRRLTPADEAKMFAVYSDPVGARFVGDGQPIERNEVLPWIEKTQTNYAIHGYGMMAIEWRQTGEVIGFIGLVHPGGQPETEVKYSIARDWWGRGIASEAVQGVVAYAHADHGLNHLIATVDPDHLASQRVLAKAGFSLDRDQPNDDGSVTREMVWSAPEPEQLRGT